MSGKLIHVDHGALVAGSHGLKRSPHWEAICRKYLLEHPNCAACKPGQSNVKPQVHHRIPFHFCVLLGRPELEEYPPNFIPLCETEKGKPAPNHHLLIGHLDDFTSSNLDVTLDATHTWYGKTAAEIQFDPQWKLKCQHRMKPFGSMTAKDKRDLRALMDRLFPPALVKSSMALAAAGSR